MAGHTAEPSPVISDIADFNLKSGSAIERLLFNNRPWVLLACLLATLIFGYEALSVKLTAIFYQMIPTNQPFIVNYFKHYNDLQSQGNALRVVVTADQGTIINKQYMATLQRINDEIFLLPGVDRPFMTSLWTSSTRWLAVTSDGLNSGPVVDPNYDGSPAMLEELRLMLEGRDFVEGSHSTPGHFVIEKAFVER